MRPMDDLSPQSQLLHATIPCHLRTFRLNCSLTSFFLENHNNSIPPGNTSFAMFSNKKHSSPTFHRKSRGSFSNTQRRDARPPHQQPRQYALPRTTSGGTSQSDYPAPRAAYQICGKQSHQTAITA
jgi:hypothetical protein